MARQTVASKGINAFHKYGGIILEGMDQDGDASRGECITNYGETANRDMDLTADGEVNAGVLVDFTPAAEAGAGIALDSANSTAAEPLKFLMQGSGGLCYVEHDADATDAIVTGSIIQVGATAGAVTLATDYAIDYVGRSAELLTAVTSTNYLYLVCLA